MQQASTEDIYRIVVEEASVLAALYTGPEIRIRVVNRLMLEAWHKDEAIIGKTVSPPFLPMYLLILPDLLVLALK